MGYNRLMYIKTLDKKNLISVFTDRNGSSVSPYMNMEVRRSLGLEEVPWVRTRQVHEDKIALIAEVPDGDIVLEGYDALVTALPDVCLATVHADCTPIQLYDPYKKVIAAVHAGWRGTAKNIAGKTAAFMRDELGCRNIEAAIGPAISLCCFEVGDEVVEAFSEYKGCMKKYGEKYHVDLKTINAVQLSSEGVDKVIASEACTFCNENFISYRREKATDQRMANIICMRP